MANKKKGENPIAAPTPEPAAPVADAAPPAPEPEVPALPFDVVAGALAERLADSDARVGAAAADALVALHRYSQVQEGLERLVGALSAEDARARSAATRGLGRHGVHEQADAVIERITDPVLDVRLAGIAAAADLRRGREALEMALVGDPQPDARVAAAGALAVVAPESADEALIAALGDEPVREAALAALSAIGWTPDSAVGEALIALARRDWNTLAALGETSVPLLVRALKDQAKDKDSVLLRVSMLETLDHIGSAAAVGGIESALEDVGGPVRASAARGVGHHADLADSERTGPVLMRLLADVLTPVRVTSAAALGALKHAPARDLLRSVAEGDPEPTVQLAAAEALASLGETGLLIDQLESVDNSVRRQAAVRLGELKAVEAIDPLIKVLGDSYATVRAASFQALAAIGWTPVGVKRDVADVRYSRWMTKAEQEARTGLTDTDQAQMLGKDLRAADALIRQAALEALSARHEDRLGELALPLLDDPVREVRETAAKTLLTLHAVPPEGTALATWKVAMGDLQGAAGMGEAAKPALLRALREHPANERAEAARTLAMIGGEDAEAALVYALHDPQSFVRVNATLSLGIAAGEGAVEHLSALMDDDHSTVRTAAGRTLATLGERGVGALTAGLNHGSAIARETAARGLATVGGEAAAPSAQRLEELLASDAHGAVREAAANALGTVPGDHPPLKDGALYDESWRVRRECARALGLTAPEGADDVLVRCLGDSYRLVRAAALDALQKIGWKPDGDIAEAMVRLAKEDWKGLVEVGQAGVGLLAQTVIEKGADKLSVDRRIRAVQTLEAIGERTGSPAVVDALAPTLDDVSGHVRAAAARAAGRTDAVALAPALLEIALHDPHEHAQVAAAIALGRCGTKDMVPALTELATSAASPNVRLAASRALAGPAIGDIALLVHALSAAEDSVRRDAAAELGKLGNKEAIDPLIGSLGDAVATVRATARAALEALGWAPVGIKAEETAEGYRRWLTLSEVGGGPENADQRNLLEGALGQAQPDVRIGALEALAASNDAGASAAIEPLLDDPDPAVRRAAGRALQGLGALPDQGASAAAAHVALGDMEAAAALGDSALQPLLRALREHDAPEREAALRALITLGGKEAGAAAESALQAPEPRVRAAAIQATAALLGAKAVPGLVGRLADEDASNRSLAARALATSGGEGAAALKGALADARARVREAVVEAIGTLEDPGPKLLTAVAHCAQQDKVAEVRVAAARLLARAIGDAAVDLLAGRLRGDESFLVREAAAEALGDLAPANAADLLVPALGDGFSEVRDAALHALAKVGWTPRDSVTKSIVALAAQDWRTLRELGAEAAPLIAQSLMERDSDLVSQRKRAEAIQCLAHIGGPDAESAVPIALGDPSWKVRAAAASAAAMLGLRSVSGALVALLQTDPAPHARARAAAALGGLGIKEAAPALSLAAAQDDDASVRSAAAIALAGPAIGDVRRLISQLVDPDPECRRVAASELGRLGNPKALDPLVSALSDAYSEVRVAAKQSLLALSWVPFGLRRTPDAKGYDRWVLRQELGAADLTTPQLKVLDGGLGHPDPMMRCAIAEAYGLIGDPAARPSLEKLLKDKDSVVVDAANHALAGLRG